MRRTRRDDEGATLRTTGKVARWGNSLGLRIPVEGVKQLRLAEGESVAIEVQDDCITIRPVRERGHRRWTLEKLLEGVTPEIVGGEVDWGGPAGKEIW
jgi:antitoxin MazE